MVELSRVLFPEVVQKRSRGHTVTGLSSQVLCLGADSLANLGTIHATKTGRRPKRSREIPNEGRKVVFQELPEVSNSMDTLASISCLPAKKKTLSADRKKSVAKKTRRSKRDKATKNVQKNSVDKNVHPRRRGLRSVAPSRPPSTTPVGGGLASMFGIQVVPSRKTTTNIKETQNTTVTTTQSPSPIEKDRSSEMVEELSVAIPELFACDSPPRLSEPPLEDFPIHESKQVMTETITTDEAPPIKLPKIIIMREAVTQTDFDWDISNDLSIPMPVALSPHVVPPQEVGQLSPIEKINLEDPDRGIVPAIEVRKERRKSGGSWRKSKHQPDQTAMTPTSASIATSVCDNTVQEESNAKIESQDRVVRRSRRLSTQESKNTGLEPLKSPSVEGSPKTTDESKVKSSTKTSTSGKRGKKRKSGGIPADDRTPSRSTNKESKHPRRSRRTTAPPERLGVYDNEVETQPAKVVEKPQSVKKNTKTKTTDTTRHDDSCIQPRRSRRTAAPPERLGVYDNEAENLPTNAIEVASSPKEEAKSMGKALSIDEDGWNQRELTLLRDAHQSVEPTSQLFWEQVSTNVSSKTASECREKWFSLAKTPMVQSKKGKSVLSPRGATPMGAVDDIFNATPMKALFQLPTKNGATKERNGPASFLLNMDFGSAIKVSKPPSDTTSTSSPTNRGYKTYINRVKRDMKKSNKRPFKGIPQSRKQHITFWDNEGDAAIKGQLSPGGTVRVCVEAGLHDEDECFSSEEDEIRTIASTF